MSPLFRDESSQPPMREFRLGSDYSLLLENKLVDLIETKSGIIFDQIKRKELRANLAVSMEDMQEESFSRYYQHLAVAPQQDRAWKKLINLLTINETFFFRVREHFDLLENVVIPDLINNRPDRPLRIWSAGSSSGEEVYSIIMTLLGIPGFNRNHDFKVLGTDINDEMLYLAEKGIYSGRTLGKVPGYAKQQYFEPFMTDRFKVKDDVKQFARFRYLNLAQPFDLEPFGRPDIIFFRNVLIYFNAQTTKRIIDNFYDLLPDDGYLFLGPSESLWDITDRFQLKMYDRAYIYRKISDAQLSVLHKKNTLGSADSTNPVASSFSSVSGLPYQLPDKSPVTLPRPLPHPLPRPLPHPLPDTDRTTISDRVPGIITDEPAPAMTPLTSEGIFSAMAVKIKIMKDEAALMVDLGDYRKAEELLGEILVSAPDDKAALFLKMTIYANQMDKDRLFKLKDDVQRLFPLFPEVLFLMGRYYEACQQWKEAIGEYRKILFIHQDYLAAREKLLYLLHRTGNQTEARREARNILEQLLSRRLKEFDIAVGETIDRMKLESFCKKLTAD